MNKHWKIILSYQTESASETGDSDADQNYSLSDYSYSNFSNNRSSSFDEVKVSALNEPQKIDLTTEKQNRKPKSRKIKRAVPSEWQINQTKMLRNTGHAYRSFNGGTEIPEKTLGPSCRLNSFFYFSEQERLDIFKTYWSLEDNAQKILSLNVLLAHHARLECL
jgi:hypothetical protein